jgi:hypothetical protein
MLWKLAISAGAVCIVAIATTLSPAVARPVLKSGSIERSRVMCPTGVIRGGVCFRLHGSRGHGPRGHGRGRR